LSSESSYFMVFVSRCLKAFHSLLLCYALLHSVRSSIKITKVTFGDQIGMSLMCTKFILALTYILTTSASMSSDNFGAGGLSVILHGSGQLGLENECLILGPLRFANHECKPNCQVSFYNTYACPSDNLNIDKAHQK
jgi:hypothetical protein